MVMLLCYHGNVIVLPCIFSSMCIYVVTHLIFIPRCISDNIILTMDPHCCIDFVKPDEGPHQIKTSQKLYCCIAIVLQICTATQQWKLYSMIQELEQVFFEEHLS